MSFSDKKFQPNQQSGRGCLVLALFQSCCIRSVGAATKADLRYRLGVRRLKIHAYSWAKKYLCWSVYNKTSFIGGIYSQKVPRGKHLLEFSPIALHLFFTTQKISFSQPQSSDFIFTPTTFH